jgi:hypothetical protein
MSNFICFYIFRIVSFFPFCPIGRINFYDTKYILLIPASLIPCGAFMTIRTPYFTFVFFPAAGKPPKDIRKLKTQEIDNHSGLQLSGGVSGPRAHTMSLSPHSLAVLYLHTPQTK